MPAKASTKTKWPGERLVTVSGADPSVAGSDRETHKAHPFHERLDLPGQIVFLQCSEGGWTAMSQFGFFVNPWTGKPFTNRKDCVKAVKYRLLKGYWPGMKPNNFKSGSVALLDSKAELKNQHVPAHVNRKELPSNATAYSHPNGPAAIASNILTQLHSPKLP